MQAKYTFVDTGIEVWIKKVSPLLVVELQKKFPAPTPPRQQVEIGGETVYETNPAHPDYQATLLSYNLEFERRVRHLLIRRGIEIPDDNTTWRDDVKELRAFWQDEYNEELEGDDKWVFISYIAIGTDRDMAEMLEAILQRSQPTQEAVDAAKATFQG